MYPTFSFPISSRTYKNRDKNFLFNILAFPTAKQESKFMLRDEITGGQKNIKYDYFAILDNLILIRETRGTRCFRKRGSLKYYGFSSGTTLQKNNTRAAKIGLLSFWWIFSLHYIFFIYALTGKNTIWFCNFGYTELLLLIDFWENILYFSCIENGVGGGLLYVISDILLLSMRKCVISSRKSFFFEFGKKKNST